MQSINIPRLADGQRATVALQRECAPDSQTEFCELVEPCFRQNEKDTTGVSFPCKTTGF